MSQYGQVVGILSCRNELDDQYNSKFVTRFSPLQGPQDGINPIFYIPQDRIVVYSDSVMNLYPQIFINNSPLNFNVDYFLTNALNGQITYASGKQPQKGDSVEVTFNFVWLTDIEIDHHLNRGANEVGYTQYHTDTSSVPGTEPLPANGTQPNNIPDGLFAAIMLIGSGLAARALALRFATKYDTSAGDQSWSPSQLGKAFTELAKDLEKRGYNARDDYYKGQGRQYFPAVAQTGYVLPNWTPAR